VAEFHAFEVAPLEARDFFGLFEAAIGLQACDAVGGQQ